MASVAWFSISFSKMDAFPFHADSLSLYLGQWLAASFPPLVLYIAMIHIIIQRPFYFFLKRSFPYSFLFLPSFHQHHPQFLSPIFFFELNILLIWSGTRIITLTVPPFSIPFPSGFLV